MSDYYVSDTELTIPDRRPTDRTIKRAHQPHFITRKTPIKEMNGRVITYRVSREEMDKLWRD